MKSTLLEIYALAICLVTVACFTITLGVGLYDLIIIVKPAFTLNSLEYQTYQSNDIFCANKGQYCKEKDDTKIAQKRQEMFAVAVNNERRNGAQGLVTSLIIILIDIFVFIPHWIIARKARC